MSRQTIGDGKWFAGDVPDAETYTFQAADGTTLDLTGYSAALWLTRPDATVTRRDVITTDLPTGKATYQWASDDLAASGVYRAVFRVWDGDETDPDVKYTSDQLVFYVRPAPVATVAAGETDYDDGEEI